MPISLIFLACGLRKLVVYHPYWRGGLSSFLAAARLRYCCCRLHYLWRQNDIILFRHQIRRRQISETHRPAQGLISTKGNVDASLIMMKRYYIYWAWRHDRAGHHMAGGRRRFMWPMFIAEEKIVFYGKVRPWLYQAGNSMALFILISKHYAGFYCAVCGWYLYRRPQ